MGVRRNIHLLISRSYSKINMFFRYVFLIQLVINILQKKKNEEKLTNEKSNQK